MTITQAITKKDNWPALMMIAGLVWLLYQTGLLDLWVYSEEYGHGLMVVALLGYILYKRRETLVLDKTQPVWLTALLGVLSLLMVILGQASGINVVSMYGVWLLAASVALAWGGWGLIKKLIVPFLIILLLIPLPNPFGPMLTSKLQLVSSQLGVWFIRAFGGAVYLEGNVLDMGNTKLLVAEACAGLRYLFPLMSLGAIGGYLLNAPLWMRWSVFLVTVPITVMLNSFRIGMTGILTERWGTSHTEGLLHFFEGWVVFMIATLLLALFCWVMLRVFRPNLTMAEAFAIDLPNANPNSYKFALGGLSPASGAWVLVFIVGLTAVIAPVLAARTEIPVERESLLHFPSKLDGWVGKESRLPSATEAVAGASEYYYGDFKHETTQDVVNVYISYYVTQRTGKIPHSPKVCIPGDGWNIDSIDPVILTGKSGLKITANRLLIRKGDVKIITYYWLKQGRNAYTDELLARINLVRSSLVDRRTDGALVRLVTQVKPTEAVSDADARLAKYAQPFLDTLPRYVPD